MNRPIKTNVRPQAYKFIDDMCDYYERKLIELKVEHDATVERYEKRISQLVNELAALKRQLPASERKTVVVGQFKPEYNKFF